MPGELFMVELQLVACSDCSDKLINSDSRGDAGA